MVLPAISQILPPLGDGFTKTSFQPFPALGFDLRELMANMGYVEALEKLFTRRGLSLDIPVPGRSVADDD